MRLCAKDVSMMMIAHLIGRAQIDQHRTDHLIAALLLTLLLQFFALLREHALELLGLCLGRRLLHEVALHPVITRERSNLFCRTRARTFGEGVKTV